MNPIIIIPTYVCDTDSDHNSGVLDTYDHMTPLHRKGELPRCLASLRDKQIDAPILVLVVAEEGIEEEAEYKICSMVSHYETLDVSVVGISIEQALHDRMTQIGVGDYKVGIGLTGYGAVKNLGLVYANSMGYTEAIFIDDDEIVTDEDFLEKACYGLGMLTQSEVPILIKSGYFVDRKGSFKAKTKDHWYNRFWRQDKGFNEWMDSAMGGSRLTSSNTVCGGCMSIHREAFRRISFDAWIPRGEDLDFLLDVRMYGSEVWFDNLWEIKHMPPPSGKMESKRFMQDVYRWMYENRKLEYSKAQIDLLRIQKRSLEPYPASFLDSSIGFHSFMTAFLRMLGRSGHRKGYMNALTKGRKKASEYARENCAKYFAFQHQWPEVVALLEEDIALQGIFESAKVQPRSKDEVLA